MEPRSKYQLVFAPEVVDHLGVIERKYHDLIREVINEQLCFTPAQPTRNRKLLEQPALFGATWELRFGPDNRFRVFYEIEKGERVVRVLAIGVKERARIWIGGEEFEV
jgi:mRNA-degrading endonuclease RelE of RelBE toxin-antitoxin system